MKKYQVTISKQMHATLEDGARRTGMSMAELADKILRGRVEGMLPLAENPADLPNVVSGKGRNEDGRIISPDGNYIYFEMTNCWAKI